MEKWRTLEAVNRSPYEAMWRGSSALIISQDPTWF